MTFRPNRPGFAADQGGEPTIDHLLTLVQQTHSRHALDALTRLWWRRWGDSELGAVKAAILQRRAEMALDPAVDREALW